MEAQDSEGNVTRLVAHDIPEQLTKQGLVRELVQEPKRCERQAFNHDLHTEIRHVPTTVIDDVVEQQAQVSIDLILATHLFLEITGEHFDVTSFVHNLSACVQLGVVPRHCLGDLRSAQQGTLLAVEELGQLPTTAFDSEFDPFLVAPLGEWCL